MTPLTPLGVRSRPCCCCGARPALLHESVCFDCYSMKETEREVARLGLELVSAVSRISILERRVRRITVARPVADPEELRARKRLYARASRERHLEERRAYNRDWMRAYRARQREQAVAA